MVHPKTKICITGASGYAGSFIAKQFQQEPYVVTHVDTKTNFDFVDLHPDDFDVIFHFAALSDNQSCDLNPSQAIENNLVKLYKLLDQLNRKTLFVFISTAALYGAPEKAGGGEHVSHEYDSLDSGLTTYAETKVVGERFCTEALNQGKQIVVLRLGTLYGHSPNMQYRTVVNGMTFSATTTNTISCVNPTNKRALLSLDHLAWALRKLVDNPVCGVYNLKSTNMSMHEIAKKVASNFTDISVVVSENSGPYGGFSFQMSSEKFENSISPIPIRDLDEDIRLIREGILNGKE